VGGFISRAAGLIHKWQRTVLSSFGYWAGDKTWIYHWDPLGKLELMQWKDVDRPTFTRICKSTINWLDYGNSSSWIQMDCLWQTICSPWRQLLVSMTQNRHSSYSMSSSRNSDKSCHLGVRLFHNNAPVHKLSATVNLFNWFIGDEGMVWESKQKILLSGHKQLGTKAETMHCCCMRIRQNNDSMCDIICWLL